MSRHLIWKLCFAVSLVLLTLTTFMIVQSLSAIDATLTEGAPDPRAGQLLARLGTIFSLFT
ncbi:MAG: hypothetical protein AAF526_10175 [Pseudomonadota bacterium]